MEHQDWNSVTLNRKDDKQKVIDKKEVTKSINIPTIGIGASVNCDGQVLVTDDLLGLNSINVRFIKKYINLKKIINKATISFKNDVKNKKFPKMKHSY